MSPSIEIKVGGQWLSTIGAWGELSWDHAADGGCKVATWKMDLPKNFAHPALRRSQLVQIKVGPSNVWAGTLTEPDAADGWTLTAEGLSRLAYGPKGYLCFDASLNTTSTPNTAVNQAIARGAPWTFPGFLSSTPFGSAADPTASLNYVGPLLDAWSDSVSKRWGVNADGQVFAVADPTVPTWHLTPDSGRFGLADDEYASDLFGRYLSSGSGYATATVADTTSRGNFGRAEYGVDLTSMGMLSSGQATAVLNGLLAKGKARLGYTNGVTASKYQLTTPGGTPAFLPYVDAGDLVRMHGVPNEQGQPVKYVDFVIGETHYQAGSDSIALTPVGLVPRTLSDVISVMGSGA